MPRSDGGDSPAGRPLTPLLTTPIGRRLSRPGSQGCRRGPLGGSRSRLRGAATGSATKIPTKGMRTTTAVMKKAEVPSSVPLPSGRLPHRRPTTHAAGSDNASTRIEGTARVPPGNHKTKNTPRTYQGSPIMPSASRGDASAAKVRKKSRFRASDLSRRRSIRRATASAPPNSQRVEADSGDNV